MRKKPVLIILAAIVALLIPLSVFAATSDTAAAKSIRGFFGLDFSKLTDKQKTDVTDYQKKLAELQKEFVNKMIANGSITKEQGDAEIKRIDDLLKNGGTNGFIPGFGFGKGGSFGDRGMRGEYGLFGIDTSKLTDKQKADIINYYKKMAEAGKALISNLVASDFLTKEKGDSIKASIDAVISEIQKNGFTGTNDSVRKFGGLFPGFGLKGIDLSKLTDKQKAYFTDFNSKMLSLQKELINQLVSDGLLTKEQGDAAISRLDNMNKQNGSGIIPGEKGNFRFKGRMRGNSGIDVNSSATTKAS